MTKIVEFQRLTEPVRNWLAKNHDANSIILIDHNFATVFDARMIVKFWNGAMTESTLKQPITLKEARLLKKASVQEVADFVGVSYHTIGKWESGFTTPGVDTFAKLLEFYGLKWGELLWG